MLWGGGLDRPSILVTLRSEIIKWGKTGLTQSLVYIHPFPPLNPIFYFLLFKSVAKKYFGTRGREHVLPLPPSTLMHWDINQILKVKVFPITDHEGPEDE
jgi:hypothetical protein